ncbi:Endonuclease/exonuclease/phosphatase [Phakopsora pachyrhizi]|uniref:Endonuclease/exonuclease/phosphatase n=1 Tax=Phakopsora pachyrhizi TaxID=170000 RepID=A0AAV0AHK0_PHAPC|nr:Endonuclease/exonuclease/phosphatase [Phakopsora pachyrhizi]CAH7666159.1 Endonuclease/exonuclease/phosphatase [Phakopsora pachyrhizi]
MESDRCIQLKFLTLNCWGLKYVSAHRVERIHAIADFLASSSASQSRNGSITSLEPFKDVPKNSNDEANRDNTKNVNGFGDANSTTDVNNPTTLTSNQQSSSKTYKNSSSINKNSSTMFESSNFNNYDVVALQELWVYHDFLVIKDRAKESGLRYSKWFHSAALGAGLAILSRYPIISSHFYAYPLNGHPLHFIQGDFFVGKAVGSCLLNVPVIGQVEVFTTHLYAPHDVPAPEWKRAHRTAQAWELAKLTRASAERGRAVFVCGDLNSVPQSLPITVLQSYGMLRDSWQSCHPINLSTLTANEASYRNAIKEEGITCDSLINTFTASKNAANRGAKGFGKRLDYIMFRPAARRTTERDSRGRCRTSFVDEQNIACDRCSVTLTEPIPVFGYSYSDHFALEASFTIYPSSTDNGVPTTQPPLHLTPQHLNNCLSALMTKYRSSERSSSFQLFIFVVCLVLTPGIAVAASFQPLKYLNWIFTLLSIFVGGLGMTMLYSGFLGGNWERSSIKEVCEQMEIELEQLRTNGDVTFEDEGVA